MGSTNDPKARDYQWMRLPNAPWASSRTDDIWFFDPNVGWLVNSSGYVAKTEDGGQYWQQKFFVYPGGPGTPYLRSMSWGSRQVGWFGAVTGVPGVATPDKAKIYPPGYVLPEQYRNALLHQTNDGGETWTPVTNLPDSSPAGICGFHAVDERVAYGSGSNDPGQPGPAIIKTVDGGKSWELIPMHEHADNLIDIFFFDEQYGYVVGGKNDLEKCQPSAYPPYNPPRLSRYGQVKPVVLRTRDGGKTWENVAAADRTGGLFGGDYPCGEWGWKIQFIDRQHGFVSLENFRDAAILKTTDGGDTWTRMHVAASQSPNEDPINNDLEGIGFINPMEGWVGGWGNDFQGYQNSFTSDGGETWVRQDYNAGNPSGGDPRFRINRYRFVGSPPVGYCSGQTIFKVGGTGGGGKKSVSAAPVRIEPHGRGNAGSPHDFQISSQSTTNGDVEISYTLPSDSGEVFVGLWNQFAFHVRTLYSGTEQSGGRQTVVWDGKDDRGEDVSRGAYIVRISTSGQRGGSHLLDLSP